MPTYEYECTECGELFELFQPITEPPRRRLRKGDPRPCNCDAPVKRRIGTGGGIIFRGSGFYQTDYRSESYKKAAKADSESSDGKSQSGKAGANQDKSSASGENKKSKSASKEDT